MQTNQARLFIAISIPEHIKEVLYRKSQILQQKFSFKRWLHPDDYHITLKFIGECNVTKIPQICKQLEHIVKHQNNFMLNLEDLHCFNNTESSKILWVGVQGDLEDLHKLQKRVDQAMEQIGFPLEQRPYRPHISIARNSLEGIISDQTLNSLVSTHQIKEGTMWTVTEIALYQTHLGQSPSYEIIATFPFTQV